MSAALPSRTAVNLYRVSRFASVGELEGHLHRRERANGYGENAVPSLMTELFCTT